MLQACPWRIPIVVGKQIQKQLSQGSRCCDTGINSELEGCRLGEFKRGIRIIKKKKEREASDKAEKASHGKGQFFQKLPAPSLSGAIGRGTRRSWSSRLQPGCVSCSGV
jgi:hypothetical protein